jgi:short-subunit dehydrogenase
VAHASGGLIEEDVMRQKPGVVVLTGASAGVGRAVAAELAKRGCRIGLVARGEGPLQETKAMVEAAGGQAIVLPLDVADAAAVDAAADRVEAAFGPVDTWINAAMVTVFSPIGAMTAEEFRRVTEVTYLGYVHGTLAALKHMRPRNRGTIVQVGSALSYRSIPLQSAYCAAKFAIRGFTDALRSELIHEGSRVRVTMVQLPGLNTPQFEWARNHLPQRPRPVAPVYQPEVAARAIVRAAERAPRELWVGKSSVEAILGAMVVPGFLDKRFARQAYSGQQTGEPALDRADNLENSYPGDHRTHGRFGKHARTHALALTPDMVKGALLGAAGMAALAAGRACFRRSDSRQRRLKSLH